MVPPPVELDRVLVSLLRDGDEPEVLDSEGLDVKVSSDDESECWELTGTLSSGSTKKEKSGKVDDATRRQKEETTR